MFLYPKPQHKVSKGVYYIESNEFLYLYKVKRSRGKKLSVVKAKELNLNKLQRSHEDDDSSEKHETWLAQNRYSDLVLIIPPADSKIQTLFRLKIDSRDLSLKQIMKKVMNFGEEIALSNEIQRVRDYHCNFLATRVEGTNNLKFYYKLLDSSFNILDEFEGKLTLGCLVHQLSAEEQDSYC